MLIELPWRNGRKVRRNIYVMIGTEPSDKDIYIGVMDTDELAAEAVGAHNRRLECPFTSCK